MIMCFWGMRRWMRGRLPGRCGTTARPRRLQRGRWRGSTTRLAAGSSIRRLAAEGEVRLGALATRRKPLQDSPTPAGNPVGAALLLRLEALNGREDYAVKALETLETFAGVVEHFGLYAASYGLALQRMVQRSVQVCVIGDDAAARRLEAVALARYAVNKSVVRLRKDQLGALPPALAETLPHLPALKDAGSFAVVCSGSRCLPPVSTVDDLIAAMNQAL